jgi:PAS domain S-box-containing protein
MSITTLQLLLIEDDPADAKLEKLALLKSNTYEYEIDIAETLGEAKDILKQRTYDIVLSDLGLPDSTGLDTFKRLNSEIPDTPIIVLSGLEDETAALEAVQLGAQDYLLKKYELDKILSRSIGHAIERKRLILESKKAKELAEASREQFKALVESISNLVLIVRDDVVEYGNPAFMKLLGIQEADLEEENLPFESFIHSDYLDICQKNMKQVMEDGSTSLVEIIVTPHKDKEIEMLAEFRSVLYENSQAVQLVMTDIGEYKKLARMKDKFLSMASHELKTPMSIISGYAQLMYTGSFGETSDEQQKYLKVMENEAKRITRFVSDVLSYARYEGEWVIDEFQMYPLKPLAEEVSATLEHMLADKDIHFRIIAPESEKRTAVNIDGIKQVFLNLISNAMKYTPAEGHITIRISDDSRKIVSVEDTGKGIDPGIMEEVFEPFVHSDRGTVDGSKGTGLGLTIVKQIVKFHKGDIWVESKSGEGTKFYFALPWRTL